MKKIDIIPFGEGQQIWFNVGRLKRVEDILGKPIGSIMTESDKLSIKNMIAFLQAGMAQNGNRSEAYYTSKIDEALDNGYTLADIQAAILKAIVGSGILGESYYYQLFPNELTEEKAKQLEIEKATEKN